MLNLVEFLQAHPTIQELCTDYSFWNRQQLGPFPPGTLPNLRILDCPTDVANHIIPSPTLLPRPITELRGLSFNSRKGAQAANQTFLELLTPLAALRNVSFTTTNGIADAEHIAKAAPQLAMLHMGIVGMTVEQVTSGSRSFAYLLTRTQYDKDAWIAVAEQFTCLISLSVELFLNAKHNTKYPASQADEVQIILRNRPTVVYVLVRGCEGTWELEVKDAEIWE